MILCQWSDPSRGGREPAKRSSAIRAVGSLTHSHSAREWYCVYRCISVRRYSACCCVFRIYSMYRLYCTYRVHSTAAGCTHSSTTVYIQQSTLWSGTPWWPIMLHSRERESTSNTGTVSTAVQAVLILWCWEIYVLYVRIVQYFSVLCCRTYHLQQPAVDYTEPKQKAQQFRSRVVGHADCC